MERLLDGNEYQFEVIATDGVGNVGEPVVYSWKIGECLPFSKCLMNSIFDL